MVHRRLALTLLSVLVASGCSGSDSSPRPEPEGSTTTSTSEGSTPEASSSLELGAWHVLVAGPDGLLLVNGHPETETDPGPLELWRQAAEGWEQVAVTGDRPSGRNFAGVAVDDAGRVVLHGGLTDQGASDETWLWDGDGWARVTSGDAGPGPRSSSSMAHDESSGDVLLYGGDDGADQYSDTWAFADGSWQQVAASGPEPVRWPATMASDPRGGVVLYGGHQVVDEDAPLAVGDTWVWRRGRWQVVAGADTPGPLVNAGSVVHPDHGLLLVGGGDDRGRQRGLVWRWTGSGWEAMPTGLFPRRQAFGLGYDAARDVVVLTGGLVEPGDTDRLQDTWEWSGDPGEPATRRE